VKITKTIKAFPSSLQPMDNEAAKDVVRRGYDALSVRYDEAYGGETKYGGWLEEVLARLHGSSRVRPSRHRCRSQ
jgi:hypothetical protein